MGKIWHVPFRCMSIGAHAAIAPHVACCVLRCRELRVRLSASSWRRLFTGDALHASKSAGRGRKRKLAADGRHFRSHLRELAVWRGIQHMGRPTIDPSRHKLAFEPFHHQTASYVANRSHLHEEQSYCLVRVNALMQGVIQI